ncbi:polysaccharide deacetylase family protein [Lysobacter humi (ex Lee et al. 2017)]
MSTESIALPHRPPRHPQAWWAALLLSQAAVAVLWWRFGTVVGLPAMLASHLAFWWGTLRFDSAMFGPVVRRLPTEAKVVWLTIDDGPSAETPAILDLLDRHGARATFFVIGRHVAARPDLAREILRRGHELGNHSESHPEKWFWALGPSRMRGEIEAAQAAIARVTGVAPVWFRAVVGMANPFVSAPLKRLGLARVGWNARGFDGVAGDPAAVVARVERQLAPGAIVLMHEGAPHGRNVEMLERLLQRLDALGYRCVLPVPQRDGAVAPTVEHVAAD